MSILLDKVKDFFQKKERATLAYSDGFTLFYSEEHGLDTLIGIHSMLDKVNLKDFVFVDRVIGKPAACFFCLFQPKEVHGLIMSKPALEMLSAHHIIATYDLLVEDILTKDRNAVGHYEALVRSISDPTEGVRIILDEKRRAYA